MFPTFPRSFQCTVLWILSNLSCFPLRDYNPLWCFFPEDFEYASEGEKTVQKPHLLIISERIQFALCRFQSLLFTTSLLVSFPSGTKTLQFPEFPIFTDSKTNRIRTSLVQRLHAPRQGISLLVASFIGNPSRVIHLTA